MQDMAVIIQMSTLILLSVIDGGLSRYCYDDDVVQLKGMKSVQCFIRLNEPVCFVCNVSSSARDIGWSTDTEILARDGNKMIVNHPGGVSVNDCKSNMYSLKIRMTTIKNYNYVYHCQHKGDDVSRFILKSKAHLTLLFDSKIIVNGTISIRHESSNGTFACEAREVILPFSMMWSLNSMEAKRIPFNYSKNMSSSIYRDTLFLNFKSDDEVSCSIEGRYISDTSSKTFVMREVDDYSKLPKSTAGSMDLPFLVKILSIAVIIILVFMTLLVTIVYKKAVTRRLETERDREVRNTYSDNLDESEYRMSASYAPVEDAISKDNVYICSTSLLKKMKVSNTFEYWYGSYLTKDSIVTKCVIKTLSDQATLKEAASFKALASETIQLQCLHTVNILGYHTREDTFGIIYEYIEHGSLREYANKWYQQPGELAPFITSLQVEEMFNFALDVADGMIFLEKKHFCHPMLSLRKVLLTSLRRCKLYDIYPNSMAGFKIDSCFKKINPPFPWMPPETIFYQKHLPGSDVWSFAVLLWELFSFGKTPHDGLNSGRIQSKIKHGDFLKQPENCPITLYEAMLKSWTTESNQRATFFTLRTVLRTLAKREARDAKSDERFYFSLEPTLL